MRRWAFYRAVKAGIVKLMTEEKGGRKTGTQLDFEMNQLLSRAVASAGILDVMGQCGFEACDVSVLTEEALAQLEKERAQGSGGLRAPEAPEAVHFRNVLEESGAAPPVHGASGKGHREVSPPILLPSQRRSGS